MINTTSSLFASSIHRLLPRLRFTARRIPHRRGPKKPRSPKTCHPRTQVIIVVTKLGIKIAAQNQNCFRNVYLFLRKPGREWYDAICRNSRTFGQSHNSPALLRSSKFSEGNTSNLDETPELRISSNVCRKSKVLHKRFSNLLQSFLNFIRCASFKSRRWNVKICEVGRV